jgi:hypothetical protein
MPSYSTLLLSKETQTRRDVIVVGWKGSIKQEGFDAALGQQSSYVRGHSHTSAFGTDGFDKLNSPLFPACIWALKQIGLILFVLMTA